MPVRPASTRYSVGADTPSLLAASTTGMRSPALSSIQSLTKPPGETDCAAATHLGAVCPPSTSCVPLSGACLAPCRACRRSPLGIRSAVSSQRALTAGLGTTVERVRTVGTYGQVAAQRNLSDRCLDPIAMMRQPDGRKPKLSSNPPVQTADGASTRPCHSQDCPLGGD